MGADLLLAALWVRPDAPLDWEAGASVARGLPKDRCEVYARERGGLADEDADEIRERVEGHVADLRSLLTEGRDTTYVDNPDHTWRVWLTGGTSWGDSPGDLYDAISDLYVVPEVLAAIGFRVDYTHG